MIGIHVYIFTICSEIQMTDILQNHLMDMVLRVSTELAALEHKKYPQWVIIGNMVSMVFLGYLLYNYSKYFMSCWLSDEQSLPFGLLVFSKSKV